jgi:N6-L-threonylcarbamoyladenine synthase
MIILGIETSCDETAVALIEGRGGLKKPEFKVLGNAIYSQVKLHEEFGGVFPMLAKREHSKNLVPLFAQALKNAKKLGKIAKSRRAEPAMEKRIRKILDREPELAEHFLAFLPTITKPKIDAIAVTVGPGLEPALWVGVNFAKALSAFWNIPMIPTNHMEGHIVSVLHNEGTSGRTKNRPPQKVEFPALALLISGGHTELVLAKDWSKYKIIGETRDDAVGEAFDKVARMLGLPYPGGPQISKLAEEDRKRYMKSAWALPRPMIGSDDFDFSFSGLKTAVLYTIKKLPEMDLQVKRGIAREFEDAAVDVLVAKTEKALTKFGAKSLILGGGVTANARIRKAFSDLALEFKGLRLFLPGPSLSTDNAIMIAMAGFIEASRRKGKLSMSSSFKATGNLKLS